MNAEQFKKANNIGYYISLIVIVSGLILSLTNLVTTLTPIVKIVTVLVAILCLATSSMGNFVFTTEKKGSFYIMIGAMLYSCALFGISGNPAFFSLSIPTLLFSTVYMNSKLTRSLICLIGISFVASVAVYYLTNSSFDISFLPAFAVLLLSCASSIFAVSLLDDFRKDNFYLPNIDDEEPPKREDVLDFDSMLDSDYPEDEEYDDRPADEDDEYEEGLPSKILIHQSDDPELNNDHEENYAVDIPSEDDYESYNESEDTPDNLDNLDSSEIIAEKNAMHEAELASMAAKYRDEISRLNLAHDAEIEETQATNAALTEALSEVYNLSSEIIGLIDNSHQEFYSINSNYLYLDSKIRKLGEATDSSSEEPFTVSGEINAIQSNALTSGRLAKDLIDISEETKNAAAGGRDAASELASLIENLKSSSSESSDSINEVSDKLNKLLEYSSSLSDVAKQAELLSLNASIESARAGEAGKGFAAVAGQVREFGNTASAMVVEISTAISSLSDDIGKISSGSTGSAEVLTRESDLLVMVNNAFDSFSSTMDDIIPKYSTITENMNNIMSSSSSISNTVSLYESKQSDDMENTQALIKASDEVRTEIDAYKEILSEISKLARKLKEMQIRK